MTLNPAPQQPTGPFMSFQALPHPLPENVQARLKALSLAANDSGEDGHGPAFEALDAFLRNARDVLGVEHMRREFLPNRRVLA